MFTTMYWTDKILFLKYMSTPPKYTTELARRAYLILEWAVVVHLFFGLFLMTNPLVFNPDQSKITATGEGILPLTNFFGRWAHAFFGFKENRFNSNHAIIYITGICAFLCLFAIERIFGIFSRLITRIVLVFNNKGANIDQFSTNLLKEISFEDL